jgi:hypothetical protein
MLILTNFKIAAYFLNNLIISFPLASTSNDNRSTIPAIWAYSRNLSLGFLPVITS